MPRLFLLLFLFAVIKTQAQPSPPPEFRRFDHVLFSDDLSRDTVGKFPSHWSFGKTDMHRDFRLAHDVGPQLHSINESGVVVQQDENGRKYLVAENRYYSAAPYLNCADYCGDSFTFECDFKVASEAGADIMCSGKGQHYMIFVAITGDGICDVAALYIYDVIEKDGRKLRIKAAYPGKFDDSQWHHFAGRFYRHVFTCFVDQYKVAELPGVSFNHYEFIVHSEHSKSAPAPRFRNFLITGGYCVAHVTECGALPGRTR